MENSHLVIFDEIWPTTLCYSTGCLARFLNNFKNSYLTLKTLKTLTLTLTLKTLKSSTKIVNVRMRSGTGIASDS